MIACVIFFCNYHIGSFYQKFHIYPPGADRAPGAIMLIFRNNLA